MSSLVNTGAAQQWQDLLASYQVELNSLQRWPEQRLIVQLFEDDLGRVLLICRQDSLVEVDRLRKLTGRFLAPAKLNRQRELKHKLGLDFIPALPELCRMETLVDRRVLTLDAAWIQVESQQWAWLPNLSPLLKNQYVQVLPFAEAMPVQLDEWDKPLSEHQAAVNHAVSRFTAKRIHQRLEETLELPPLSESARAILELRNDPDADAEKLAAIIEADASLAAQVVGWASNAYFSAPGKVRSVQDAVVRVLGYELVMNLALGLSLSSSLTVPQQAIDGETPFWQQSLMMATVMNGLNRLIPESYRPAYGLAYLTGLLHNFGYLVLAQVFKPQFATINPVIAANPHLEPSHIEQHILGINREQIATLLLSSWHLPVEVVTGIRFLHQPDYLGSYSDYAQMAAMSLRLLRHYGLVSGPDLAIDESLFESLQINPTSAQQFMQSFVKSADEMRQIASMME